MKIILILCLFFCFGAVACNSGQNKNPSASGMTVDDSVDSTIGTGHELNTNKADTNATDTLSNTVK